MTIRLVDFRTKRHKQRGKDLLTDVCGCIEEINCEVAGYAVFAWMDDGTTSFAFQAGGPVGEGGISAHITRKVERALRLFRNQQ